MLAYIWPIALVVASNILYQICCKSVPEEMNPFASLTITYLVAALASAGFYFWQTRGGSLPAEYARMNWVPPVLGIVIVGLEVGFIYAYKAGWPVSTASVVQSSFLAAALIGVGFFLYREPVTGQKLLGIAICLAGLYVMNR